MRTDHGRLASHVPEPLTAQDILQLRRGMNVTEMRCTCRPARMRRPEQGGEQQCSAKKDEDRTHGQ